jgi:hypothetical protein
MLLQEALKRVIALRHARKATTTRTRNMDLKFSLHEKVVLEPSVK